ncbi:reductive dehalogenase membrane anchor [Dehalococcoides mccartyi]|jgi:multisubunit Na+/H+ antiporter MnhE subunit|uniref:dehalogenase n=1 Tax=Dehalococcoides mccartyi TaxID=61435 RepID=UPI00099B92DA|nr:dehalogenase [Dehalococcoides mccartyi]AQX75226.1 reductive dehalogenase membrane anchor [Dehalococcoides mccartyi]AQY73803.1 reductive dehalogenase membrane anchor [Dehalococcoides mccartyi]
MWFIIGILVGALVLGLVWLMKRGNFSLTWYEWLIGAIGALMLLFTVQNYFGSLAEVEPKAASMFLLVVGLPGLVLLALAWQLAARRVKKA